MSIILKGIDMPKKNLRVICLFPHGAEELVVLDADSGSTAGRPIEAIQIPKGHGDIKDVGNIIKQFDENIALAEAKPTVMYADAFLNDALEWSAEYIMIKDDIDNAPTILEAEE